MFATESVAVVSGANVEREFHVTAVTIRLRIGGPDGKPRSAVRVMISHSTNESLWSFPASGQDGHAEVQVSPGSYRLAVMPKRLTDQKALRKFYTEHSNDPQAMRRVQVQLDTIEAVVGEGKRIEVRLPVEAGY